MKRNEDRVRKVTEWLESGKMFVTNKKETIMWHFVKEDKE